MRLHRDDDGALALQAVPPAAVVLDDVQRRAVDAHDGVVQVIAPAGSGKTTVLIARARELLRRGTPAKRILCTTFNKDARVELETRLAVAGLRPRGGAPTTASACGSCARRGWCAPTARARCR